MISRKIFEKETKEIVRDKVFIVSIFVQFIIIGALLFLYVFYSQINVASIPVVVTIDQPDAELIKSLRESGASVVVSNQLAPEPNEPGLPRSRNVNAYLNTTTGEIRTDVSNIYSGFALSRIRDATDELSFEEALEREGITYEASRVGTGNYGFLSMGYGLITPMAIILPAFVVMAFTLQSILIERKRKTIELLLVSPISDFKLTLSKIAPYAIVSTLLSIVWLLMVGRVFSLQNFPLLVIVSFIFSFLLVSASTLISTRAGSVREANAISSLIGMGVPMLAVLPNSPLTIYFPTVIISRIASNAIELEIIWTVIVFAALAIILFLITVKAVKRMRVNYL